MITVVVGFSAVGAAGLVLHGCLASKCCRCSLLIWASPAQLPLAVVWVSVPLQQSVKLILHKTKMHVIVRMYSRAERTCYSS
jgi:hypothetical protein